MADGRIIPVLILDCSAHQELYELILLHEHTPPGDATLTWGRKRFDKKHVFLKIEFSRPLVTRVMLSFTLERQAALVDGIINSRGVYLQPLQSGRRVTEGLDKPKIIVEVPSSATFPEWPKLHRDTIVRTYRSQGAPRTVADALADQHLARLKEIWSKRQRPKSTAQSET